VSAIFRKLKPLREPARYIFKDPDSGREFQQNTRQALINEVVNYRINNRLEAIENLNLVLENYWCSLPENIALCDVFNLKRGWTDYLKGGIALLKDSLYPADSRVTQEEAEERALICKQCPYNVRPTKTGAFQVADDVVETYLGKGTTTSSDKFLGTCSVCTCPLRFKVHVKGPFDIDHMQRDKMVKVSCWQLKG
jgi:hypothetical protein